MTECSLHMQKFTSPKDSSSGDKDAITWQQILETFDHVS